MRMHLIAAVMALTAPAFAAEHVVTISGSEYSPTRIAAKVGDTVRFVNEDAVDHSVFVPTLGHAIDLGATKSGAATVLTLRRAGRIEVECVQHGHMGLIITVTR